MKNYREELTARFGSMSALTEVFSEEELYVLVINELVNKERRSDYNRTKNERIRRDREELRKYREKAREAREAQKAQKA